VTGRPPGPRHGRPAGLPGPAPAGRRPRPAPGGCRPESAPACPAAAESLYDA